MLNLDIIDVPLSDSEYINAKIVKDTIWLHHTAGSHRPDWIAKSWDRDRSSNGKRWRIATAFIIGGKSTRDGSVDWDGKIVRAFPEELWAYHLAAKRKYKGVQLDPKSIGIEICNWGHVTKTSNGEYYNYIGSKVPSEDVYKLSDPFRGHEYWHKYTPAQIESTRKLLIYLSEKFNIDLKKGLVEILGRERPSAPLGIERDILMQQQWLKDNDYLGSDLKDIVVDGIYGANTKGAWEKATCHPFETQDSAFYGQPGLWTHTNCRADKTNCHPQPELIEMLKTL
jgi:hypothetical protein